MEKIEETMESLLDYRDALGEDDRKVFDKLVDFAKSRVKACAKAKELTLLETMLLAMLIEQQKRIEQMQVHC